MADDLSELLDVVDAADRVIGTAPRGEVHRRGLFHRAVHILIKRADGDLFLQKRSAAKDTHPLKWDSSASGHLDAGESYPAAAVRELEEELGLVGARPAFLDRIEASPATDNEFVEVYGLHHEGPFRLHPGEISGGRWVAPEELSAWIERDPDAFAPGFRTVLQCVRYWAVSSPMR
ncbi:MAG: NUDIX domain-containing protein [Verrucomicrobia bacterium]|jgi:16S rRNA (adenine1518-N6/adenine1519-N6)-dimethyltransferase|nr:NUDIX domain-containing protein [Verrucomicrobiota bacterium]